MIKKVKYTGKVLFEDTLRTLGHRNYRLYLSGQLISLIGTWMQGVALSWLIYKMTSSPFLLGTVAFVSQIPSFILAPLTGVFVDRHSKKKLMIMMQILSMLQAILLTVFTFSGIININYIIAFSLFLGLVNALEVPTRQAILVELIDEKKDLGNAIALNSAMFHATRLVGPSIAGVVISVSSESVCFLVNSISFIAALYTLIKIGNITENINRDSRGFLMQIKEGVSYISSNSQIGIILVTLSIVALMGSPYMTLLPVVARDVLHGDADVLGFLMGFSGLGSLAGALNLASRKNVKGIERLIFFTLASFGLSLALFSFSQTLWVSLILSFVTGFSMLTVLASSNTILQTIVEDRRRGVVMSFFTMAIMGVSPIGSLVSGSLASVIGAPLTILAGSIGITAAGLLFFCNIDNIRERLAASLKEQQC